MRQHSFKLLNVLIVRKKLIWTALLYYKLYFILQQGIPDDCDEFGEFRLRVADLIKDCVFIVGSGSCFRQVRRLGER